MHTIFEDSANSYNPLEKAICVTIPTKPFPVVKSDFRDASFRLLKESVKSVLCTNPLGLIAVTVWDSEETISRYHESECDGEVVLLEVRTNVCKNVCLATDAIAGMYLGKMLMPSLGVIAGAILGGNFTARYMDDQLNKL